MIPQLPGISRDGVPSREVAFAFGRENQGVVVQVLTRIEKTG